MAQSHVETGAKSVIVVGAGWAGLIAAKTYLQVDPSISLTIIEADRTIGGTWSEDRTHPYLNSDGPVGTYEYSDLPMSDVLPVKKFETLHSSNVYKYLVAYAEKFKLLERCRLSTQVLSVRRDDAGTGWIVRVQTKGPDDSAPLREPEELHCDKLILATGLTSNPNWPDVPSNDFAGPIIHSKQIGKNYTAILAPEVKNVVVYGGCKSSIDAINMCINADKHVDWVIRDTGSGAGLMANIILKFNINATRFLGRYKDIFTPSIFALDSFWYRFLHSGKSKLGTWLINRLWKAASETPLKMNPYTVMTPENREKLLPETGNALFFSASASPLHNCPRFVPELGKPDGLITIHRASITSLQKGSLTLSNGETRPCDAAIYATGWSYKDEIFDPKFGISLGLPEALEYEDAETSAHWAELHDRADKEVVSLLPILANPAPHRVKPMPHTPWRLYKFMIPTQLAAKRDRSLIFFGYLTSTQTVVYNEVAALWAVSWMEDLVDLGVPESLEDIEYQVAKVHAWASRRYLDRGRQRPLAAAEIQHVIDQLMRDMKFRPGRYGGLGLRDTFLPPLPPLYKGLVEEFLRRARKDKSAEKLKDAVSP